ncbi:MAG: ABC transporter permease [Chitinophagaceae bacterium]|nr:ABC transporter permease [Anaerolineae bacterium]
MATPTTIPSQINEPKRGEITSLNMEKRKSDSLASTALRRLRKDYLTLLAFAVLITLALMALLAPVFENALNVSYTEPLADRKLLPIGTNYLNLTTERTNFYVAGTDNLGRDVFTRLMYGGRVSLGIGVSAALFSTIIGVTIGLLAGFYQGTRAGFIDDFIMWFVTTLNSIPTLMLLILISAVLTPSITTLIIVLTIVSWSGTMRLIRGETLGQRENEYVISARAMGASPIRIMFVHILPNTLSILVTALAIEIGSLILTESALSFLGLGVRPPEPSWGNMLTGAQSFFRQAAHLSILPGLLIVITVLSLFLIGDGLRDALDPRSVK